MARRFASEYFLEIAMNRTLRYIVVYVACLIWNGASLAADPPASYAGKPIRISVLNTEGQPLADTFIVARWVMMKPDGLKGAVWYKDLHIAEAITDTNGNALIPEWGPITRPHKWKLMRQLDPKFIVFKAGYAPLIVGNTFQADPADQAHPAKATQVVLRVKTYEAELAENPLPTKNNTAENWRPASALQMLKLVAGQLTNSVGLLVEDEYISRQLKTLVAVDMELQRLSASEIYHWGNPRIENRLARARDSYSSAKSSSPNSVPR